MAKLNDITNWLNDYLKISEIQDNCWNGLQLEGQVDVNKIALAVDSGKDVFQQAHEEHAEMLIVHHGHFWKGADPSYTSWRKERLAPLITNNISLYASHLPLDRHPDIGHNAQLVKQLGATITEGFYEHNGVNVGYMGQFEEPVVLDDIIQQINTVLHTTVNPLSFGSQKIRTIAVCSGGGGYSAFFEALNKNVDLYITGDTVEIYQTAKDARMNVIFAGHYATETLGLKALGLLLKEKHPVDASFIDVPTGL